MKCLQDLQEQLQRRFVGPSSLKSQHEELAEKRRILPDWMKP